MGSVLRRGDRGTSVRHLQQSLRNAGFSPGPIDGVFGRQTEQAVRAFQRFARIQVDGVAGRQTFGRLSSNENGRSRDNANTVQRTPSIQNLSFTIARNNTQTLYGRSPVFRGYSTMIDQSWVITGTVQGRNMDITQSGNKILINGSIGNVEIDFNNGRVYAKVGPTEYYNRSIFEMLNFLNLELSNSSTIPFDLLSPWKLPVKGNYLKILEQTWTLKGNGVDLGRILGIDGLKTNVSFNLKQDFYVRKDAYYTTYVPLVVGGITSRTSLTLYNKLKHLFPRNLSPGRVVLQ